MTPDEFLTQARKEMAEAYADEEHAYDGQCEPQKRDLTVKERDVLCHIITLVLHDPAYSHEDLKRLIRIREAISPRKD